MREYSAKHCHCTCLYHCLLYSQSAYVLRLAAVDQLFLLYFNCIQSSSWHFGWRSVDIFSPQFTIQRRRLYPTFGAILGDSRPAAAANRIRATMQLPYPTFAAQGTAARGSSYPWKARCRCGIASAHLKLSSSRFHLPLVERRCTWMPRSYFTVAAAAATAAAASRPLSSCRPPSASFSSSPLLVNNVRRLIATLSLPSVRCPSNTSLCGSRWASGFIVQLTSSPGGGGEQITPFYQSRQLGPTWSLLNDCWDHGAQTRSKQNGIEAVSQIGWKWTRSYTLPDISLSLPPTLSFPPPSFS